MLRGRTVSQLRSSGIKEEKWYNDNVAVPTRGHCADLLVRAFLLLLKYIESPKHEAVLLGTENNIADVSAEKMVGIIPRVCHVCGSEGFFKQMIRIKQKLQIRLFLRRSMRVAQHLSSNQSCTPFISFVTLDSVD